MGPPDDFFAGQSAAQNPGARVADRAADVRITGLRTYWVNPVVFVRLETNRSLVEAIRLYRENGYSEVERFNDEPYADHWFEKEL